MMTNKETTERVREGQLIVLKDEFYWFNDPDWEEHTTSFEVHKEVAGTGGFIMGDVIIDFSGGSFRRVKMSSEGPEVIYPEVCLLSEKSEEGWTLVSNDRVVKVWAEEGEGFTLEDAFRVATPDEDCFSPNEVSE